jgi:membrane-associated phospholipid phosphatase
LVEIKVSQSIAGQVFFTFMNHLTLPLNFKQKPYLLALGIASVFFAFSAFLITSGLNQTWMLAVHASPVLPPWFWSLLNLGGDAWVVLLFLLIFEKQAGQFTSWIIKTWLLGAVLVQTVKHTWPMPRPGQVLGIDNLSIIDHPPLVTGSMPSGHALAAVSCALMMAYMVRTRGTGGWTIVLLGLVAGLIAWSRVAVGAHWPADVIAGAGLAVGVVALAYEWDRHRSWNTWFQKKPGHIFLIVLHIFIAIHLAVPQSDYVWIQFIQWMLSGISLIRAFVIIKKIAN